MPRTAAMTRGARLSRPLEVSRTNPALRRRFDNVTAPARGEVAAPQANRIFAPAQASEQQKNLSWLA
jgi:hypothetical protein